MAGLERRMMRLLLLTIFLITLAQGDDSFVDMDRILGGYSATPAATESPYKRSHDIYIGFWGTTRPGAVDAAKDSFGNAVFDEIRKSAVSSRMYFQSAGDRAINDLMKRLDRNSDFKISQSELKDCRIHLFGYSWGAITAVEMCHFLNWKANRQVEGDSILARKNAMYKFSQIRVDSLLLIDPVTVLRGTQFKNNELTYIDVPENVYCFRNFYQSRGGDSLLRDKRNQVTARFGTFLSRRLTGSQLQRKVPSLRDHVVDVNKNTRYQTNKVYRNFNRGTISVTGREVNHDTIPWFVKLESMRFLKSPFNQN